MAYPHNRFAPTNPLHPEPVGICHRCSALHQMRNLDWQYEWRGASLANIRVLVCRRCLDVPQEQLRVFKIGPDPVPPRPSSPTFYAQQNASPGNTPPLPPLLDDSPWAQPISDDTPFPTPTPDDTGDVIEAGEGYDLPTIPPLVS